VSDLIGPSEAARQLGVSTRTVQRWLRDGRLDGVRVGSRIKVSMSSLSHLTHVESDARSPDRRTTARPLGRLMVANRGELVVRIARTCRAMGITSVALATDDQRHAWWTTSAHEVVPLASDYLDVAAVVAAAVAAGVDAVHPGYGFLAERPEFAEAVIAAGLLWVGPPPSAMRALGDKAAARRLAAGLDVPVLPGYDGRAQSDTVLSREAARVGFPLLVKPSAGGGGKGMHVVRDPRALRSALTTARREAGSAFGDARLILERYLEQPRHVEVQLLLDAHGQGIHLGERDCSLQRRHQKVVEEAPAPGVGPELRARMGEAALRLAKAAGYVGAGTAEFLLADDGAFVFLEMNARLQVEHPVTEAVTGIDLVAAQLRIAGGETLWLTQTDVRMTGHAIEGRLYAEDPWNGFLPAVGRIVAVRWPSDEQPGIRVDAGVGTGDEVGTRYDPLLAKVVASGSDRDEAIARVRAALSGTSVLGVTTNRGFLAWLLALPEVADGAATTESIETRWQPDPALPDRAWPRAAALLAGPRDRGFRLNGPRRLAIEIDGQRRMVDLDAGATTRAPADDALAGADSASEGDTIVMDIDGRAVRARLASAPSVDASVRSAHQAGGGAAVVTAPMPGVVIDVLVESGQAVEAHQALVLLEAMKMENAVTAPGPGTVERVLARPGQQVQRGEVLVELRD
jgi:3-methylcrotonyl-CoA carboxylase alpha subunit